MANQVPCPAGAYSSAWGATSASTCQPCQAAPGSACAPGSSSAAGSLCLPTFFCPGQASPALPCPVPERCPVPGLSLPLAGLPAWSASTLAGSGWAGSANGQGQAASFSGLGFSAVDPNPASGDLYFTEPLMHTVRRCSPTGAVSAVAGLAGSAGYVNGAASKSRFSAPAGLVVVPGTGAVIVSDQGNHVLRMIVGGMVSTLAGVPGECSNEGGNATFLGGLCSPGALALSAAGYLYVADASSPGGSKFRIRQVDPATGNITFLAGTSSLFDWPEGGPSGPKPLGVGGGRSFNTIVSMAAHPVSAVLYIVNIGTWSSSWLIVVRLGDEALGGAVGGSLTVPWGGGCASYDGANPRYCIMTAVAVNPVTWELYVSADANDHQVRIIQSASGSGTLITSGGITTTIAGAGWGGYVDGQQARFSTPLGLAVSPLGHSVYVLDRGNQRIRLLAQVDCGQGMYCPTALTPSPCPPGRWCNGTAAAYPCPAGTASSAMYAINASVCAVCPAGTYCASGSAFPARCPPGRYQPAPGAISAAACLPCTAAPGYGCAAGGTSAAGVLCPLGSTCTGGAAPPAMCDCPGMCNTTGLVTEPFGWTVWGITTLAGSTAGTAGYANSANPLAAMFHVPLDVSIDAFNNNTLYVTDYNSFVVRAIAPSGAVSTHLGRAGIGGWQDGFGSLSLFNSPRGVAVAGFNGSLLVTDGDAGWNSFFRLASPNRTVTTLAPARRRSPFIAPGTPSAVNFNSLLKVALSLDNTAYVTSGVDTGGGCVSKVAPDGSTTTLTCGLSVPNGVAVDAAGAVFVSDQYRQRVYSVSPAGVLALVAGNGLCKWADGTGASASFCTPIGIASNSNGVLFVADQGTNVIRRVTYGGVVTAILGGGGPAPFDGLSRFASLKNPQGIAVRGDGALVIVDTGNHNVRLGQCMLCPEGYFCYLQVAAVCPAGYFCPSNSSEPTLCPPLTSSSAGAGGASDCAACPLGHYCTPGGIGPVPCPAGTWGSTATLTNAASSGPCSAAAGHACGGGSTSPAGEPCPPYFYCPGGASPPLTCSCPGVCASGGLASEPPAAWVWTTALVAGGSGAGYLEGAGTGAVFNTPYGISMNGSTGPLFVTETGNHNLRTVSLAGVTALLTGSTSGWRADGWGTASSFNQPRQVAFDPLSGNIFVADFVNSLVRLVNPVTRMMSTLAGSGAAIYVGGKGALAAFKNPSGIALTPEGLVIVADTGNHMLRLVTQAGVVSPYVGSLVQAAGWVDGASLLAGVLLCSPTHLAVNRVTSDLFFIDQTSNNKWVIRKLSAGGVVSTVAGSVAGYLDSATPSLAQFNNLAGIAVVGADGRLVVSDALNNVLRLVSPAGAVSTLLGSGINTYMEGIGSLYTKLILPGGLVQGTNGALYWLENHRVRKATCDYCPAGGFCADGAFIVCPAGNYCPANSTAPTPCPPSTYGPSYGAATVGQCQNCTPGFACSGVAVPLVAAATGLAVPPGPLGSGTYVPPQGGCTLQLAVQGGGGGGAAISRGGDAALLFVSFFANDTQGNLSVAVGGRGLYGTPSSGGGASGVRLGEAILAVAGGGGGAGMGNGCLFAGNGGGAGVPGGSGGNGANTDGAAVGGCGGTQTAGGCSGNSSYSFAGIPAEGGQLL